VKSLVVVLAPDVAKVFKTGESVNDALRAILKSGPATKIDGDFEWREIALAAQGVRFVAEELSAPCI
jgi:hypothetical protein